MTISLDSDVKINENPAFNSFSFAPTGGLKTAFNGILGFHDTSLYVKIKNPKALTLKNIS